MLNLLNNIVDKNDENDIWDDYEAAKKQVAEQQARPNSYKRRDPNKTKRTSKEDNVIQYHLFSQQDYLNHVVSIDNVLFHFFNMFSHSSSFNNISSLYHVLALCDRNLVRLSILGQVYQKKIEENVLSDDYFNPESLEFNQDSIRAMDITELNLEVIDDNDAVGNFNHYRSIFSSEDKTIIKLDELLPTKLFSQHFIATFRQVFVRYLCLTAYHDIMNTGINDKVKKNQLENAINYDFFKQDYLPIGKYYFTSLKDFERIENGIWKQSQSIEKIKSSIVTKYVGVRTLNLSALMCNHSVLHQCLYLTIQTLIDISCVTIPEPILYITSKQIRSSARMTLQFVDFERSKMLKNIIENNEVNPNIEFIASQNNYFIKTHNKRNGYNLRQKSNDLPALIII